MVKSYSFVYFSYNYDEDHISFDIPDDLYINLKRFGSVSVDDVIPIDKSEPFVNQQNDLSFLTVSYEQKETKI